MSVACVLQHISCEPPGVFEEVLSARGVEIVRAELDEADSLPSAREADLVIVMGGPMGVDDEAEHPWLRAEKRWIEAAVRTGMPYFGVCLGAQLLAASLGAPVRRGAEPEVGVLPVELTAGSRSDPVFSALGSPLPVLQWHGDTFDLPVGAVRLGSSRAYENQAFRFGTRAYGVQFHLEVTGEMFEQWKHVPAYAAALRSALGPAGAHAFEEEFALARPAMAKAAASLFNRFLDLSLEGR